MNTIIRLLVAVSSVLGISVSTASAQTTTGWIEFENALDMSGATPQINIYAHGGLSGKLGWTFYTQSGKPWSEGLVGLTFAPTKWIEVSASLGLESDENPFRQGASVWVGTGKWSLLTLQEDGGSGHWQKNVGAYQATKKLAVGVLQQTHVGAGPYAELKFGKMAVWGSYAVGDNRGLMTVKFNF